MQRSNNKILSSLIFFLQWAAIGLGIAFTGLLLSGLWSQGGTEKNTIVQIQQAAPESSLKANPTLQQLQQGFSSAVSRAAPAVVYIYTARVLPVTEHPFLRDQVFRDFFASDSPQAIKRLETGLGSGVITSPQGYILTNFHVVRGADEIQVQLNDGRSAIAQLIGSDPDTDLAVLKIPLDNLPAITLGRTGNMKVGDLVLAIGNPFGVGQSVTMGIISATGRSELGVNTFENYIQTDAAINPGNSGGALINQQGHLIGINTAQLAENGGLSNAQGLGFAIPVDIASNVMQQIIAQGHVTRGWIGLEIQDLHPNLAYALKFNEVHGSVIRGVQPGGPADDAGLKTGDIILKINNESIRNAKDALNHIVRAKPGHTIKIQIYRDGMKRNFAITPGYRNVAS